MTKYTTTLVAALLSGLVGAVAGYLLGRSSVPVATLPASAVAAERTVAAATGQEIVPGAPVQNLDSKKPEKREPLTAATFRAELASVEAGGFYGRNSMRKYAEFQERLKVSDLPAIAAEMCSGPSPDELDTGQSLVLAAYVESDAEGAWNFALGIKRPGMRGEAVAAVISSIAGNDPALAMTLADSLTEPQLKSRGRSIAISIMAGKDPEAAKAAVALLSGSEAAQARRDLVLALAQKDPKAAWAYAATLPASSPGDLYGGPRVMAIENWAQYDPQAALQAAFTIGENDERSRAIATAVNAWAETDFSAALNYAISVEDAETRGNILENLSRNQNSDRKVLLQAVLEYVPPGASFHIAVSGLFSRWASENPAAAAAAAMQLPAGLTFSKVASEIASQWMASATNKQEVFDWVRSLPAGEARSNSMGLVFSKWSNDNPQAAAQALSNLTAGDRKSAAQSVASGWARISPDAALKWSSSLTDPAERSDAVRNILSQWAGASPESAAKYVATLPESGRAAAMENVVSSWISKDAVSAAAWLDKQPAGPSKDGALRVLSQTIAQEDPEAALTWVAVISDEKDRLRQTENIVRDWIRQDPVTAKSWISRSKLPEDTRNKLLK